MQIKGRVQCNKVQIRTVKHNFWRLGVSLLTEKQKNTNLNNKKRLYFGGFVVAMQNRKTGASA